MTDRAAYFMAHGHPPEVARRLCVDFDGTLFPKVGLFDYPDPLPGAAAAMQRFKARGYHLTIYTSRLWAEWADSTGSTVDEQRRYIEECLTAHDIPYDRIEGKPGAAFYIDDLALRYAENWTEIADLVLWKDATNGADR